MVACTTVQQHHMNNRLHHQTKCNRFVIPWKVCENECPFFRRHFVLLGTELVKQLFAHRLEDKLQ